MKRNFCLAVSFILFCAVQPAMSESKFRQKQDEALFMAVGKKDPEFAQAISGSQSSLPVFRRLLATPEHSRRGGTIRMVKTYISEGTESMWLWLNVEKDNGTGFDASVFEAPPQFPNLKAGTIRLIPDSQVADWAVIDNSGLVNGGYSLRLARLRLPEAERPQYDSYIGAKVYAPLPSN